MVEILTTVEASGGDPDRVGGLDRLGIHHRRGGLGVVVAKAHRDLGAEPARQQLWEAAPVPPFVEAYTASQSRKSTGFARQQGPDMGP